MVDRSGRGTIPAETASIFRNWNVVHGGFATAHQAILGKLPLLVAVTAKPLPRRAAFILEAHGNSVVAERP